MTAGERSTRCTYQQNKWTLRKRKFVAAALISTLAVSHGQLAAEDNEKLNEEIQLLIGAHNVALPVSVTPTGAPALVASIITASSNLGLKYVKAPLSSPIDKGVYPTTTDNCSYQLEIPQTEADYTNLLGLWDVVPLPTDWGPLGPPHVSHANTDVTVSVDNLGSEPFARTQLFQRATFPAGNHYFQWQAETQLSLIFDVALPVAMLGHDAVKYSKSVTAIADTSAQQAARQGKFLKAVQDTLENIAIELGLTTADLLSNDGIVTVTHADPEHVQQFSVFDVVEPSISTDAPTITFEATDFGGTSYARKEAELFATIFAADGCGRPHSLYNDAPELLELGENIITWTVQDMGPIPPSSPGSRDFSGANTNELQQVVLVKDTQPPLMVPPPGKVYEASGNGLDVSEITLGIPQVVDLADSSPTVFSNAPDFYPINSRTEVIWETSDASNNTAMASQWITVKEVGTNTQPEAQDKSATTRTSEAVDIELTGSDEDLIDGIFDPLSFSISKQPDNGEFVAPLYPYFIEDYRTQPGGPFGEEFLTASPRSSWVGENYCSPERLPLSSEDQFVYEPLFMVVTDDGTQYIKDRYWKCSGGGNRGETSPRISKWDSDGNYIGQGNLGDNVLDQFVLDRDGRLYLLDPVGSGSSTDLFLKSCSTSLNSSGSLDCETSWKFNSSSAPNLSPGSLVYARVDSQQGLAFVTDKRRVFVFDIRAGGGDSIFLGTLKDGEQFLTSCTAGSSSKAGFTIDIDSNSNLYIADSCANRIHKFAPSGFTHSDEFAPGDYVGWLGKCDTSTNKACDEAEKRSKGYSCTDETCSVGTSNGDEQGQFSVPLHIAIDPNDVLYVADYANQRIQRFGPDGSFAGEAVSTGTGINMGDEPGFILGNFDSPKTVSVNSTQFFIVDQAESFVHVFETSPFTDITDDSVTVTYVSDFSFHSNIDTFEYTVTDGLATSEPAEVSVTVNRNFRAPTANEASYTISEDGEIELELTGDDPDGIIGSGDFNPLDVLTFEIIEPPANGELMGRDADYIYQPDANFHGTDSFTFVASDGELVSEVTEVTIEVTPVNDPPVISLQPFSRIGVGFDTNLRANFTDDNLQVVGSKIHFVTLDWGDGTEVTNGPIEVGGALVVSPATESLPGLVMAKHTYATEGEYDIEFCIVDIGGEQDCKTETVDVANRVALGISVEPSSEELGTNEAITYDVQVTNLEPDIVGNGLVAEAVSVVHELPVGLQLNSVSTVAANCSQIEQQVSCEIGDMQPGDQVDLSLVAMQDGTVITDREAGFDVTALTSTNAVREYFVGYAQTTLLADDTDSDNDGIYDVYEANFGLVVGTDDSALDPDGDGLTNIEEFNLGTHPNSLDTDGDGLPDGWEADNGLKPLTADASLDSDGDGFSNREEYLADRNPLVDEESGSRLVPVLSVFANSLLTVPAVQVGSEFYDLVLELKSESPVLFELIEFQQRDIQVEVPDVNLFNTETNVLTVSLASVDETFYRVELNLTGDMPIQLGLVSAEESTVSP